MTDLAQITHIVAPQLEAFEREYADQLHSSVKLANTITDYLNTRRGKQLRPLLTLLSAGACQGEITQHSIKMAVAMEMLHNSSLIHDDVVDESSLRRGIPTVNNTWGNKIAVLSGDFYLAKVMTLLCRYASTEEMDVVNGTAVSMSEGELLQQQTAHSLNLDEENYIATIEKKTASLIASCCEIGSLAGDNKGYASLLRTFGLHFGLAFQMRDDMLDYMPEANTGKPYGNDIQERKMTLPLINYLATADPSRKEMLLKQIADGADEIIAMQIVAEISHSAAMQKTQERINSEIAVAIEAISPLPDSIYKQALIDLATLLTRK